MNQISFRDVLERDDWWNKAQSYWHSQGYTWEEIVQWFIDADALETTQELLTSIANDYLDNENYFDRLMMIFQLSGYRSYGTGIRDSAPIEIFQEILDDVRPVIPYENMAWTYVEKLDFGRRGKIKLITALDGEGACVDSIDTSTSAIESLLRIPSEIVTFDYLDEAYCILNKEDSVWRMARSMHDMFNAFMQHIGNNKRSFFLYSPGRYNLINICADRDCFLSLVEKLRLPLLPRLEPGIDAY